MRGEAGAWLASATLVALGLCLPVAFLGVLYKTEQNNLFCVSCHLHEEKFGRFQARRSATDLAGAPPVRRPGGGWIDLPRGGRVGVGGPGRGGGRVRHLEVPRRALRGPHRDASAAP